MKNFFLFTCIVFYSIGSFAQKVTVENNIENVGDGYNMAFKVAIPYTTEKIVTKKWTSFLKKNHAKVKSSRGSINGINTVINGMGTDSMQVFSRITERDSIVTLIAAFQRNGTFIAPATSAGDNTLISRLLYDFGIGISREGIEQRAGITAKILSQKLKEQSNLSKNNARLESDNDRMKKSITKNEKTIDDNIRRLEDLKKEIGAQEQSMELIKTKTKELEEK